MDKYMRMIGLRRAAKDSERLLNSEVREVLEAYAEGVNFAVSEKILNPIEFQLLNVKWHNW
jgi:acyl-homoserine lactone acylase PvdQ